MSNARKSPVALHMGEVLLLVANTYPRLLDFVLEIIQNSLDANAKQITVKIDMQKRSLEVTDDGLGVSREKFEQALTQICQSMKTKVKDALGRFGRGLISPLGKCEYFTFTSCPRSSSTAQTTGYIQWNFNTADIQEAKVVDGIPVKEMPQFMFCRKTKKPPRGISYVPWRTQVKVFNITADKYVSRISLQELVDNILAKYGVAMRRKQATISIFFTDEQGKTILKDVEPKDFTGRPLPVFPFQGDSVGDVIFRLFIAPNTIRGRKGKVVFGEKDNDFRISGQSIWNDLGEVLQEETIHALRSGIFEGEILGENVRIHPDRKRFQEDDAFVDFCVAIDIWYQKIGAKYAGEIATENRERRYQELGLRSMKVISEILRQPEFKDLLGMVKVGSIGNGHYDLPAAGLQPVSSMSNQGAGAGPKSATNADERSEASREYPEHHPGTVAGPDGQQRRQVRSGSTGLQFRYVDNLASAWEFDPRSGVLVFNTSHRFWFDCEETDTALMRYHEVVTIQALSALRVHGTDMHDMVRLVLEDQLAMLVFDITHGDALSGRRGGRKK